MYKYSLILEFLCIQSQLEQHVRFNKQAHKLRYKE
jgi:hypothetical protein